MSSSAFTALRSSGAGAIINISMTLHYGATWFQVHASAAKAAIDSLTRWGAECRGGILYLGEVCNQINEIYINRPHIKCSQADQSVDHPDASLFRTYLVEFPGVACVFFPDRCQVLMAGFAPLVTYMCRTGWCGEGGIERLLCKLPYACQHLAKWVTVDSLWIVFG